jgi:hypothetical protein
LDQELCGFPQCNLAVAARWRVATVCATFKEYFNDQCQKLHVFDNCVDESIVDFLNVFKMIETLARALIGVVHAA